MGQEASDASTDRFRRGGVGGAHRTVRPVRGLTSPGLGHSLSLSVLLLPTFVGCVNPPDSPLDGDSSVWLLSLLLAVSIVFILLAAGVRIKIPKLVSFQPPDNRAGQIFLAVLGLGVLSMSLFLVIQDPRIYLPFASTPLRSVELSPCQTAAEQESRPLCRGLLEKAPEIPTPVARLSGEVSFIAYEDEFENYYSTLRIGRGRQLSQSRVGGDGQFSIDVPFWSTVAWRAIEPSDYVLWPMEIDPPAGRDGSPTSLSFEFLRIDDVFIRQKNEAIQAIQQCEFERADAVLNVLLPILEQLTDRVPRAQTWPHDVHRDLANEAVAHRDCADGDGGGSMSFERKWRREAIERATTLEGKILAMNTWAGLSREMYRPQELAWPDASLVDVDLISERYRDSLREDLQLVRTELARSEIRDVVSNEILPTGGIDGCLDVGQRDALRAFKTLLSEPVRGANLNRLMNAISGLQRIVSPRWQLGTWIDYLDTGDGEIEIIREWKVDRFEYRFRFTQYGRSEIGGGQLTLEPEQSAPCRFGIRGAPSDRRNREAFVILEDGFLRREPAGLRYPAKRGSAEPPDR